MLSVYKKELRSYFTSVIGYVFLVLYLALGGAFGLSHMRNGRT